VSALAIVLIVAGVLVLAFFVGGVLVSRRRAVLHAGEWAQHVAAADHALEAARAADKGWDRALLEEAARGALAAEGPRRFDQLHLVLVDDRPGVAEDRAHFMAVGPEGQARVILARRDGEWVCERID
jgi:hypothetical protein